MKNHIFISYSSKDAKIAFQLVDYLEQNGISCWIAPRNIASGHDYTDTIDEAIKNCDGFILIFSGHSARSQWVKKELSLGISHDKNVIPFRITNTKTDGGLNFMLNNLQWIEGVNHPTEKFPEIIEGLRRYDNSINAPSSITQLGNSSNSSRKKVWLITAAVAILAVTMGAVFIPFGKNNESEYIDSMVFDSTSIQEAIESVTPVQETETDVKSEKKKHADAAKDKKEAASTMKKTDLEKTPPTTKVQEPEPVPVPVVPATASTSNEPPTSESASPQTISEDKSAATTRTAEDRKFEKAVKLFNNKRYNEALKVFEELKASNCQNRQIDAYINSCRKELSKSN